MTWPSAPEVALVAPAAVRIIDLETPLSAVCLATNEPGDHYRSVMVVARLEGEPLGAAALPVEEGRVSRFRLAGALQSQLEGEIGAWYARRGRVLPDSLPPEGIVVDGNGAWTAARSVSVVVATCGYTARFERCLRSILASRYEDFEIVIVDSRPAGGAIRSMLAERFADKVRLRCVEEPRPGLAFARNAGLMAAEGDVVAFTDDDVIVDHDWVGRSAEAFDRADDVACVTGLILPYRLETDGELALERSAAVSKGFHPQTFRLPDGGHPLLAYTRGVIGSGANTVVRADIARRIDWFDTRLGTGTPASGGEDLDLYIRLLRAGHAIAYEPSAIVRHDHPGGSRRLRRQVFRHGVGVGAALSKHILRGPRRLELLRSAPAGKRGGYPLRFNWLERAGMLLGPAAYLTSVATRRSRAQHEDGKGRPPLQVERVALSTGRTISVVSFLDGKAAPPGKEARSETQSRSTRALLAGAALICLAAPLAIAPGLPSGLPMAAVLALVCVALGTALVYVAPELVRRRGRPNRRSHPGSRLAS
jgi:O-antigen biosynthesis protein